MRPEDATGGFSRPHGDRPRTSSGRTTRAPVSPPTRGNRIQHPLPGPVQQSIPAWAGKPSSRSSIIRTCGIYPRVGGGTRPWKRSLTSGSGLSPRGRGNLPHLHQQRTPHRSILAWAGEPTGIPAKLPSGRVYPRVGGGTPQPESQKPPLPGLSPRGRGNLNPLCHRHVQDGSIPAWAGEPPRRWSTSVR